MSNKKVLNLNFLRRDNVSIAPLNVTRDIHALLDHLKLFHIFNTETSTNLQIPDNINSRVFPILVLDLADLDELD